MKVFEILVYAIIAIVAVMLFYSIISYISPPKTNSQIIKVGIEQAQTPYQLGKEISLGELTYQKDTLIHSVDFTKDGVLVSFECNSARECCTRETDSKDNNCTKTINWDYDFAKITVSKNIQTSVRCTNPEGIALCKVFFGTTPAQARIESIQSIGETQSGNEIKLTVKNTGKEQLAFGKATFILLKKAPNTWVETEYASNPQEIKVLAPGEKYSFFWTINPKNIGEYKAIFRFEGLNAGYDENSIIFNKTTNYTCLTDSKSNDTVFNSETKKYNENYYCTGCNYAYECVNVWNKQYPSKTFIPSTKDFTYCEKNTYEDIC